MEADHQSYKDPSVNALVKNWRTKEPLVLIADDKYEHFPFDLTRKHDGGKGYAYVVLGYYFVRHYWGRFFLPEVMRWRSRNSQPRNTLQTMGKDSSCALNLHSNIAGRATLGGRSALVFLVGHLIIPPRLFHRLNRVQRQPCHLQESMVRRVTGNTSCVSETDLRKGLQIICDGTCFSCKITSPQVYEQGWMCLRPGCESHFQLGGVDAITVNLTYTKAFLTARPSPKAKKPAVNIPKPISVAKNGIVTTPLFYHGWHCQRCGRLSCR